jgi:hypothetical protein
MTQYNKRSDRSHHEVNTRIHVESRPSAALIVLHTPLLLQGRDLSRVDA